MKSYLKYHIKECGVYQQMKHETCKLAGLIQPLPISIRPWVAVSMDFVSGLPTSQRLDIEFLLLNSALNV